MSRTQTVIGPSTYGVIIELLSPGCGLWRDYKLYAVQLLTEYHRHYHRLRSMLWLEPFPPTSKSPEEM